MSNVSPPEGSKKAPSSPVDFPHAPVDDSSDAAIQEDTYAPPKPQFDFLYTPLNPMSGPNGDNVLRKTQLGVNRLLDAGIVKDYKIDVTNRDGGIRAGEVLDALKRYGTDISMLVYVAGGDGTLAEVVDAALEAQKSGYNVTVLPGPFGVAYDLNRTLGIPPPKGLTGFLPTAIPTYLDIYKVRFDGGPERTSVHSVGLGVSGHSFPIVSRNRLITGEMSMWGYAKGLSAGVLQTKTFFVRINGGKKIPVGEVMVFSNSPIMGSLACVPLPVDGGLVVAVPVVPDFMGPIRLIPGLAPVWDVLYRGIKYRFGDDRVIAPGQRVGYLKNNRLVAFGPTGTIRLELFDEDGVRIAIPAILNGDPAGEASLIEIRGTGEKVKTLARRGSAHFIRHGTNTPKSPMQKILERGERFTQQMRDLLPIETDERIDNVTSYFLRRRRQRAEETPNSAQPNISPASALAAGAPKVRI